MQSRGPTRAESSRSLRGHTNCGTQSSPPHIFELSQRGAAVGGFSYTLFVAAGLAGAGPVAFWFVAGCDVGESTGPGVVLEIAELFCPAAPAAATSAAGSTASAS